MCARPPVCGRACTKPNPTLSVKSDEEQGRGAWRMSVLLRAVCACVYKLATLRCRARAAGRGRLGAPGVGVGSAPAGQSPSPPVVRAQTELMLRILSRVCASLHAPTKTPLPHSEPACGTGAATMWAGLLNMFIDDCVLD